MGFTEINLPDGLLEELERIAKKTSKTKAYHIKRALQEYLEEYRDLEIALERSRNKKDRLITSEQLKKALGI